MRRRRIELFLVTNYYFTKSEINQFHHHHRCRHHHHRGVAMVVVVMIIIMMNNAVADQKWDDFFNAIGRGEIAKVKMLFEANRSLFLNSAFPDYAAYDGLV